MCLTSGRRGVVHSSPAQHPQLEILVAYCSLQGAEAGLDPDFGVKVAWDIPLLDGYPWVEVPNKSPCPGIGIGQDRNMVIGGQCPPEKDESPACRGRRGRMRRPARRVQAGLTGLEPATSGVTDRHSNQLSYSPLRRRVAI